jgi:hypothetical protein
MIITGDLPLKYLTKTRSNVGSVRTGTGVQAHPSDVYIRENGRSFFVHEETPGAHVPKQGTIEMPPFDFMDRVPKQFAPKLLKAIYGKSLPTKAHIETLRLNVRYQDDKETPNSFYALLRSRKSWKPG